MTANKEPRADAAERGRSFSFSLRHPLPKADLKPSDPGAPAESLSASLIFRRQEKAASAEDDVGINVPVPAGEEGGWDGDVGLMRGGIGSLGAAIGVSPEMAAPGWPPERGFVHCDLSRAVLSSPGRALPSLGSEQPLEFLPWTGDTATSPSLGSFVTGTTPGRAGRGFSPLERIPRVGAGAGGAQRSRGVFSRLGLPGEHRGRSLSLPFPSTSPGNRGQGAGGIQPVQPG